MQNKINPISSEGILIEGDVGDRGIALGLGGNTDRAILDSEHAPVV
jgi:hypothetical protein